MEKNKSPDGNWLLRILLIIALPSPARGEGKYMGEEVSGWNQLLEKESGLGN
jgi:hypothetical protein